MTEIRKPYPVRVDAPMDAAASRGLWLIKWLLLIPHFVVLAFLWLGFVVVSVLAFFAILITGRYPRGLFEYNVGVLRWSWRVHYYGYGALGTDRYPPFTLADDPGYPAHLELPCPERLSRGLVLVKWWLLAIPHYLILAVFVGGGAWFSTRGNSGDGGVWSTSWGAGGLVGLLVLIAGVVLLFTGRYPRPLYEFVLGMDRWALRVAAYAALMTDEYPSFRLDMGGPDPGSVPALPTPPPSGGPVATSPSAPAPHSWTAGRVVSLIVGAVLLFAAAGALLGGGAMLLADRTQRAGGYLWTPTAQFSTDSHAVTSDSFRLEGAGLSWAVDNVLGRARVEVNPADRNTDVFVGIARTPDAARYLRGVGYTRLDNLDFGWNGGRLSAPRSARHPGGAPAQPPGAAGIWVARAGGPGTHALTWRPSGGDWTVVVMRADGAAGVAGDLRAGVTAPGLSRLAAGVLAIGAVLLAVGGLFVALAARREQQLPGRRVPTYGGPPEPRGPGAVETAVPTEDRTTR